MTTSPVADDVEREAVHATRGRAALLLTDAVVLRAVARALEPLAAVALRHAAAEVRALLVQRDEAVLHAGEQRLVRGHALRPSAAPSAGYCVIHERASAL